jgi:hypothetical protein
MLDYEDLVSIISRAEIAMINLLDSKALPGPFGETADVFIEVHALFRSPDPALWVKFIWIWEDRRIKMHQQGRLADWSLISSS